MDTILVSVICRAYNHSGFINKTLLGLVNQKTSFKYEVIVHDDASTDGTTEVIKQFAEKYPDIIVPIYQNVNQYSKNILINKVYIYPIIRGKYIAMCEGDDYWISDDKLQKQVDYIEKHDNCYCVCCGAIIRNYLDNSEKAYHIMKHSGVLSIANIVTNGGDYIPTCSMLMRKEVRLSIPDDFSIPSVGDLQIPIYASLLGYVYYIDSIMCQYNYGVPGSWTVRANSLSEAQQTERLNNLIKFYSMLEEKYLPTNQALKKKISKLYAKRYYLYGIKPDQDTTKYFSGYKSKVLYILGYFKKILRK